jgi:hypothetical protein
MSTVGVNSINVQRVGTSVTNSTATIPAGKTYFSVYNAGTGSVTITFGGDSSTAITVPSGITYTDENNNGFVEIVVTAPASTTAYIAYSK